MTIRRLSYRERQGSQAENWVFLGDSLTEGVGSRRVSFVTELARLIRKSVAVGELPAEFTVNIIRLRKMINNDLSPFDLFNLAGFIDEEKRSGDQCLWLWNLGCEGKTIESDEQWLSFLDALGPSRIVIFRGALESILRPSPLLDNQWPWWVPKSWRTYAAMDPRCYFSSTWWRKGKQAAIDSIKQKVRLRLLSEKPGCPLVEPDTLIGHYSRLLHRLSYLNSQLIICGLIPVSDHLFPGSAMHFRRVNELLRKLAESEGVDYLDWGENLEDRVRENSSKRELFYRDSFHPNENGARFLAGVLYQHLYQMAPVV